MKKLAFATMLAAASSTAALAQSSVTLFGVVDAGIGHIKSTGTGSATGLVHGGTTTGRLGFRGTEDLGGGLAASFWLEGELQTDTGTPNGLNFTRRSTVSLSSQLGELRLGRDLTPSFINIIAFDATSQRSMSQVEIYGANTGALSAGGVATNLFRSSNSIAYYLPSTLGGFYGNAMFGFSEKSSNQATTATNSKKQGQFSGVRVGYAAGKLDVGGSYGVFNDVVRNNAYLTDYKIANVGASYNFGVIKPFLLAQSERTDGGAGLPAFRFNTFALTATAPIGVGVLRGGISRYDNRTAGAASGNDATKVSIGYVYSLSKRTAIYSDIARVNNKGGAAYIVGGVGGSISGATAPTPGGNSTGITFGLRHSF